MNKKLALGIVILVVGGLAFGALSRSCVSEAHAQQQLTPALALARLCISEAGWDCFASGDGAAIHEVILRGAARHDIRYTSYARAYAQRLFGARPHDNARLRWVGQINETCVEPTDWPTTIVTRNRETVPHPAWSTFRARCLAVVARARTAVSELTFDTLAEWSTCDRPVHDWGGDLDEERARRIGLVPVTCGTTDIGTRNTFYCRPGVDTACMLVDRD